MSEVESSLNALGSQLLPSITKEDSGSFNQQQQQYQEQQNTDSYSEENLSSCTLTEELMEIPQVASQCSSIDSTLPTLDQDNSSNSSTQSDVDTPFNPISFLNTMHQKLKTSEAPVYSFSHDPATGQFYCQVKFCQQTYQNNIARPKKQQAKEEAANIAMKDLSSRMPAITDSIRQELIKTNRFNKNTTLIKRRQSYQQQIPHPLELIPKSVQWYEKQAAQASQNGQPKRPCVLLLEFCQMHKLGYPTYIIKDDGRGYYLFDCTVYNRVFNSEMSFWKKSDAKDHVSHIAFGHLYKEFVDKEQCEIQKSYGMSPMSPISPPPLPPQNLAFPIVYPNAADGNNYTYYCN